MELDVFEIPENAQKVAVYFRNGWQLWPGTGGNFKTEWVASLVRNMHNEANIIKLALGRIDCYVNDDIAMLWEYKRLKENGIYDEKKYPKLKIGPNLSKESGYLAFTNRNDSKFHFKGDFRKQFNDIIEKMKADGEIEKIVDSYIK